MINDLNVTESHYYRTKLCLQPRCDYNKYSQHCNATHEIKCLGALIQDKPLCPLRFHLGLRLFSFRWLLATSLSLFCLVRDEPLTAAATSTMSSSHTQRCSFVPDPISHTALEKLDNVSVWFYH